MGTGTLIAVLCLLSSISELKGDPKTVCSPGLNTSGITVPRGDIALLYGQPLDLYCILHTDHEYYKEQGYNSSMLMFARGMDRIESEYVTVVNSTTIHLYIPRPAISESMYYCKLQTHNGDIAVCLNHVAVGTEPQDVDNFECFSLNWNNLTCTWKPPHNYLQTYFSLSFRLPRRNGRLLTYQCPNMTMDTETGQYFCFWDLSTSPPYRQSYSTYYFNLTSFNKFGSRTQDFLFNHYAHLKPNRPTNVTADHKTQHSCQLHWSLPDPMKNFPPGVIHRIIYRTDLDETWYTVNSSGLPLSSQDYSYNLTDLPYAYRYYNVRVAIRSEKAVQEKYWSDYASVTFRTLGKPPERAPPVDIGSFEVSTNLNHRNVTVYWKQFQIYEENGDNFLYKIEVLIDGVRVNYLTTQSKKGYIIFKTLPLKTLQFLVSASNIEGDSPTKSSLIVPPQNELLPEPSHFTKAALGNGTYELTWKAPKINSSVLTSYTVFWCDNSRDRPFQCEGRLQWARIPADITSKNFTVPDDKIYQYAISANGQNTSSGMVWASCTVIPNKAVGKIKEIWTYKVQATFIEVRWKLECPDNVGVIKGYRISCCPIYGLQNTKCREAETTIVVMHSDNIGILSDLKPYTTYAIQVAIIAKHEVGPQSDPILSTTSEAAPDPPRNISISGLSSTRMLVSWQPPLNMNGVLLYYMVYYRPYESSWTQIKVENNGYTEKELIGLLSYTNYTVRVEACTVACSTPSEELVVRTAIGAPGRISRPVISNYLTDHKVEWNQPEFAGGTLDLYEVNRVKVRQDSNESEVFNTTDTYLKVPDRICQEEGVLSYLYSVRAINFDSADDHGAAAFTYMERVTISRRPPDDYNVVVFPGPWSSHAENTCTPGYAQSDMAYWIIGVVAVLFIIILGLCVKKAWIVIDKMRSIKPIMPDGLFPESEKDSKYPLGNWNPPPKHSMEHDAQYPSAPADEVSLLGSPSLAPASPGGPTTTVTTSGSSSRRANSPAWPSLAPYSAVGAWPTDESDAELPPPQTDNPYVSFATEPPSAPVPGGYVQAAMLPPVAKEIPSMAALPPSYVLTAPDVVEPPQVSVLPSSYVRTAPEPTPAPTPRVAVVSPYVTVDDARFAPASSHPPPDLKKEVKSGYVTHNHSMFNNPKTELPVLEHPTLPKRVSAPPLFNTKLNNENNKRISLSNYTTVGLDNPDPACSPEYCRFGWNSPEDTGVDHQHVGEPREDSPPPINIANLGKEEYELPLEDLLSDETAETASIPATASHYLPLNLHTLKS